MYKTKKEQKNALAVGIVVITMLLMLLMVIILLGIGVITDTDRESQVVTASYVTQSEYLEGVEVSEREFKEIKGTQSNYQKSVQQVNERLLEYAILFHGLFIIVLFSYPLLLINHNIAQ